MIAFKYKALSGEGKAQRGVIYGNDVSDVTEILKESRFFVISVKKFKRFYFLEKDRLEKEIFVFFKQFSLLLNQKIPLVEVLKTLETITDFFPLKMAIHQISLDIHSGIKFSQALEKHRKLFTDFVIACLYNAEKTGNLIKASQILCDFLSMQQKFKKNINKITFYPLCIFSVLFLLIISILKYLIPTAKDFLYEIGNISISQKILIFLSDLSISFPILFFSSFFAFFLIFSLFFKKFFLNRLFYEKYNWIFWLQSISALLLSGVPLKDSLRISTKNISSLKKKLKEVEKDLLNGESFSESLAKEKGFLPSLLNFLKIGESSGQLGEMLFQCAKFEQENLDYKIETFFARFSPLLLLFAGLTILWIVLSIFLPFYENLSMNY
ncbi:MAG: type II secretion system F family protein [Holosporales bacterium]|jgi:type IV pilus assembly protein PilC|nr:type II secretion system F family protein [Holosporales bacterium]